jgi:hypothetical protein
MKTRNRITSTLAVLTLVATFGCDTETPTTLVVENDGFVAVYKLWYASALFTSPVAPGSASTSERGVRGSAPAYALLAPGWDPSSSEPPPRLVPVRSTGELKAKRGDELRITVSDTTFVGDCAAGSTLSQDDADFITQRIFPGDFAGVFYDAKTCTTTTIAADGGGDAATDAIPD